MTELKLRKEGDSLAVTIPAGIASNMKVTEGNVVHLTELPGGGYRITPYDPELVAQMRVNEDITARYRNTLKVLGE
jgi:antitoxin component of MazEF toxin-antitoxin module